MKIGDEHVPRSMRDHPRQLALKRNGLRCDPTGPENRQLISLDRRGISEVRLVEIDPEPLWVSNLDGRTVCERDRRCQLNHAIKIAGMNRAHGDDEWTAHRA